MNQPVFVVGVPRSGTTLLRVMLDSHREIACGPEFPFLTENVARIWGRTWPCTESFSTGTPLKIFRNFDFSESDVHMFCAGFVDAIFSEFARRRNKRRWAIKVPRMVEKMDYLSRLFPDAFFVHVIRDGRDVVASSLSKKREHPRWYPDHEAEDFARDWVQMIGTARSHAKRLSKYHELRYDHLIEDPRARMQDVLSFIDASWDEDVLRHHELRHDYSKGELSTVEVQKPLYTGAIGRWRNDLSESELSRIMNVDGFQSLLKADGFLLASQ